MHTQRGGLFVKGVYFKTVDELELEVNGQDGWT